VRPKDLQRAALRAGRKPTGAAKKDASIVKGIFADIHGETSPEYGLICAAIDGRIDASDIYGMIVAEYLELRVMQETESLDAAASVDRRIRLLDMMRKLAVLMHEEEDVPSAIQINVSYKSAEEREKNRGPGLVVK
jgi:hypothetical protein